MCGVFAYIARDDSPVDMGALQTVAIATEVRGPHAWGVAWIDGRGVLRSYKQPGRITDSLDLLHRASEARVLIGHCRFATRGHPWDNLNNHPHPADGGWIVHNGIIRDYETVVARHDLAPVSGCDSELLGLLIENARGSLLDRCVEAALSVPRFPFVMLGLWKPGNLVAIRAGNPLWLGRTRRGFYLASLPAGLPGSVREMKDHCGVEFGEETHHASF